ncbi:heavy metal-binding domain-containing protein [Propionimicrobium sp. PCR01-08-3]|uniref:heavy metal-binding domain-containing protein n=1 Tax=Propionimicrobium sp. PCR01-08-3 TaxID=3052086 RepID=UPI00255CF131|nr:heavy metal-binding domain-containing protein [Propionimicrobium sp. PCR01-08-3]WIY82483.1 heavy metal-binding domain-containing protein [Propionimicrobium sp. PCR01-08-3]
MLVVTMSQIPGYRIEAVLGEVFGVGAQQQMRPDMGPAEMVYLAREQAIRMMVQQGQQRSTNAIIGYSIDVFQSDRFGAGVTAIGTAVKAVAIEEGEDGATPQSIEDSKIPGDKIPQPGPEYGQSSQNPNAQQNAGATPPPLSGQPPQLNQPVQPGQPQGYPGQAYPPAQPGPGYAYPGQQPPGQRGPQQGWGQQQYPQGYGR